MTSKILLNGLLSLTVTIACAEAALARSVVFSELGLSEAKVKAKNENKLLLVDFTATWCPPCGEMEKTTWEDPKIIDWFKKNGIAIQVDVDKEKSVTESLHITAMPSLVVFKGQEQEVDRQVGFQDSAALLEWLDGIKNGVTSMDVKQQALNVARKKGGAQELDARQDLAEAQIQAHRYSDALENYIWLWQNMLKIRPSMYGVKYSFFVEELQRLIDVYPDAKVRFSKLRDEAELTNLEDWLALNRALGDTSLSLAYFDKNRSDNQQALKLQSSELEFVPLLIEAGRWADVAFFVKNPSSNLKRSFEIAKEANAAGVPSDSFAEDAGQIYASLLAAGRDEEAEKAADESLKLQNSAAVKESLVFTAVNAGQLKPAVVARLEALDKEPSSDSEVLSQRASAFIKLKKFDKALADLSKAIELAPTEAVLYDARESVYCELKDFDKALADANHVISIYPKSDRSYISRGFVHLKQHRDTLALQDFEQALKLNPGDPLGLINESAVYIRQGKFQLAFDTADKAVKLSSKNAGALCNRGEAALGLKRYEDALADLTNSIALGEKLCGGENFFYRAKVYEALGKTNLAKEDRESANRLGFTADDLSVQVHPVIGK